VPTPGMLSQALLQDIACQDVRAAAILARGFATDAQYQEYSIDVEFTDGGVDSFVKGQLDQIVTNDLVWTDWRYSVMQPDNNNGNLFQAQQQYFNSLVPNIDLFISFAGWGGKYLVGNSPEPIQNVVCKDNCPRGRILYAGTNATATFYNRSPLVVPQLPTRVVVTIAGISLGTNCWQQVNGLSAQEAREQLANILIGQQLQPLNKPAVAG